MQSEYASCSFSGRNDLIRIILLLLISFSGCSTKLSPQIATVNKLPPRASEALHNATTFELFSLEPGDGENEPDSSNFHGWKILGSLKITDNDMRSRILNAFEAGIAENDGSVAACFDPRHGIRVTHQEEQHDFVICFRCHSGEWYTNDKMSEVFLLTDSPQPIFDRTLKEASVTLATTAK